MSETRQCARASMRRLKTALSDADEETRFSFAFWILGLAAMTAAIVAQFGWTGVMFCVGILIWKASGL